MLISAGTAEKWNTMTASWGGVGVIWGKPSATCYIRHSRYTKEVCRCVRVFHADLPQGRPSGRPQSVGQQVRPRMDKIHDSGLTPVIVDGQPTFAEAELVLICRKRCKSEIAPEDILHAETLDKWYARQGLPHHVHRRNRRGISRGIIKRHKLFTKPISLRAYTEKQNTEAQDCAARPSPESEENQ